METEKADVLKHYATKEDLQGVRIEVQAVLGEVKTLRAEMRALHAEMLALHAKAMEEIQRLRTEIERALHAQTWKMVGLVLTVNIATVTAVYYIASN